jgi:hypothetical protein
VSIPSDRVRILGSFHIVIEKKSDNLVRALVTVAEISTLSKEDVVSSMSIPEKPIIQKGG